MASAVQVILGNEITIATAFLDAAGAALATDSARFQARVLDHRLPSPPTPSGAGTGEYETTFRPDRAGRWKWRVEGLDGSGAVIAADEGEISVVTAF